MKIILWNTQWAPPGSERERMIREIVLGSSPDLVCITEGYRQTWEDHGHLICSQADYGYPITPGRRKILLLSRTPWSEIDDLGQAGLPPGRFVSGVTQGIRCFGICVPWKDAHVRNGRKDRLPWEDHVSFLDGLSEVLDRHHGPQSILLGDFNQRIPRIRQPVHVFEKLEAVLGKGFSVQTKGLIQPINELSIDHCCVRPAPRCVEVTGISNVQSGVELSDHFGLLIEIALTPGEIPAV